ncbi:hypothetical protein HCU64_07705 [Methylobacterium sp. C25]|uniref:hypothetical protein n=1 Tax=Methylobacterium sp. C25 TaxID=2721622 RepID=UPI001F2636D2|nr:hypothetical protein [Methylobacterium sp. C25]MCE4223631.1 hypothetical protein [Methylobacterium sp. C25]
MADTMPISDPEGFPTNAQLKKWKRARQTEAIVEWFGQNFEDPAHSTPYNSEEGGYLYIWGGPYDTSEEILDRFDGIASKGAIADAISELESEGSEWAPSQSRIQPEEDDYDGAYGPSDHAELPLEEGYWRAEIGARLDQLETALAEAGLGRAGIGHNNPPSPIQDDSPIEAADLTEIQQAIGEVRTQTVAETPDGDKLSRRASQFKNVAQAIGVWLAKKGDLAFDEGIKIGVKVLGAGALFLSAQPELERVQSALNHVADAIVQFVHLLGF